MTVAPTASTPGVLAQVMGLDHCLLVVRHGRTLWNDEDRMSTRTDIPLTDAGRDQARQVGIALTGAAFDFSWTSPLERARETASIALAGAESPAPVADARLTEPDGGPFEGITFEDLETGVHAVAFAAFMDSDNPIYPPGCAPLEQSVGKARAFLADVGSMPGRHFAVAHGAIMRIMAAEFLGMNPVCYRRLRIDNCHGALWRFWPQPPHQLAGWNLPPASMRTEAQPQVRDPDDSGQLDPHTDARAQPEKPTPAEQAELAEQMSRMSVEMPFDSSEYLDGPSIGYEGEEPLEPFPDPSELSDPDENPKGR